MLSLVLFGFATIVFFEYRSTRLAEVDSQLEVAANALDSGLRLFPPYELRGEPAPVFEPKGFFEKGPNGRPPKKDGNPPPMPQQQRDRLISELGLPNRSEGMYYGVWRVDGTPFKSQGLTNETPRPYGARPRPVFESRQKYRELFVLGPQQSIILVGRSMERIGSDIRNFAINLIAASLLMLTAGLLGVWLISRRIFRPIATITETASQISAQSLSQRINENDLDIELVDLARVLNETFENLEESFERQQRFTADASHELRTPLAVLRSQAELTLSRPRTSEEYQQALQACLRAADRMTELTNRMLKLAQADAAHEKVQLTPVELLPLLEDTSAQLSAFARQKQVTVRVRVEPIWVLGDAPALAQVFANLLSNAIAYNNPRGRVSVEADINGKTVTIKVSDTGQGIPADDLPHLFERFYRVDKARSQGGYGLGLAISKGIIESLDGEIGCTSVHGEGSTFWVKLRTASALDKETAV